MYVMSDDMILEDLETLKQVRGRLQIVLDKLIASCLLLFVEKEEDGLISRVRMHDVVRDVAIRIASEEANGIFVKAGVGLRNWPERVSLLSSGNCLRLSLMGNEINGLPDQPELPNLLSLSLEGNRSLKKLHDSFFQSMEALVALDISRTGISSLPTSLSFLVNLRSLHLGKCALHEIDISIVGKLKKLEILNLSSCELSSLPEEIGGLSNLKLLDLSRNLQLNFIPPNVIKRLSRLEELYMLDSFKRWKVEPTGDGTCASLSEVASLKCVQLDIENDEIKARISIGCGFRNQSYLTAPSPICHSIRVLLARADHLKLSKCTGLKSVGQLVIGDGFKNMKILRVEECNEMEYLMSVVEDCEKLKEEEGCMLNTFPKLKELYLKYLPKLTIIWKGVFPIEILQYLKVMEVTHCHGLRNLFSTPAMVLALQQLEKLEISNCNGMTGIVAPPEEMVQKDQVLIPPHTSNALPPQIFPNLRELVIDDCNRLKDLYPLTKLSHGGLSQLRRLQVEDCKNLEEIFLINTDEEEEDHDGKAMLLPQLEKVSLENLPSLIWNIPIGSLQNLREVSIDNCSDSLNHHIFPVSLVLSHQLEILDIRNCKELKAIIDDDDDDQQVLHHQLNWSILLPRLKRMVLVNLPNLMTITNGVIMSFGIFQNLEYLIVERCNSLKHILPIRLLVKLKQIYVKECNEMKVIFNEDGGDHDQPGPTNLERLYLISLPKLSKFHRGPPILDWPSLEVLYVKKCKNLKRLPLNHPHSLFPKLKEIEGDSERWLEEELEWEDESLKSRLRPLFMTMVWNGRKLGENLPELKEIVGESERWFDEELEWKDETGRSQCIYPQI